MHRVGRSRGFGQACVALLTVAATGPLACADESAAKPAAERPAADKPPSDSVAADRGPFEAAVTAKGGFEPVEYAVAEFRPESWAQPLEIHRVVPHGALVNAGDPLVEFDTEKLDRAIADLKVELALNEKALEIARNDLPAAEALHPLEMAEAERQARVAAEDLARFLTVEKAAAEEQARFAVRAAEERLKYAREELGQLEKMYKDKDLTEDTEEMILQRTRFDVVQAEQSLKRIMENSEETLLLGIPRREVETRRAAEKAAIALEKAKATLPMQLAQKKLALAKQEHERAESLRRLAELEADRAAATLRSPRAGMVYYGRFREGTWSTAAVAAKALARRMVRVGGAAPADRAARGFRLVLARPPTAAETERLVRLQADAVADFRADAARAKKLATEPLGPLPTDLAADEAELAAWTVVANVILNLDEAFMCP